jgi:hypothetical protein
MSHRAVPALLVLAAALAAPAVLAAPLVGSTPSCGDEKKPKDEPAPPKVHLPPPLRWRIAGIAAVLGCRDFAGVASMTLASIYLQKAHGYSAKQAGFTIGAMMLISILINPLAVYLTPGQRRLPSLSAVLVAGGVFLCLVPFFPAAFILPLMCLFQTCQLGSYAMSDAAMLERVSPDVRGRVVGLFLVLAGTFSATAPFVIGYWTDVLRGRAAEPLAYAPIFATLAGMMAVSAFSTPLIARLAGRDGRPALAAAVA